MANYIRVDMVIWVNLVWVKVEKSYNELVRKRKNLC